MPIHNQRQADALTEIITVIRCTKHHTNTPDWHEKATMNVLRDNHNHPAPYPDIVQALTKYAATSDKQTPAFLFDPLRDWKEPGNPRITNPCESHPTREARNCTDCWSEIKTGMRPKDALGKHWEIPITGLNAPAGQQPDTKGVDKTPMYHGLRNTRTPLQEAP